MFAVAGLIDYFFRNSQVPVKRYTPKCNKKPEEASVIRLRTYECSLGIGTGHVVVHRYVVADVVLPDGFSVFVCLSKSNDEIIIHEFNDELDAIGKGAAQKGNPESKLIAISSNLQVSAKIIFSDFESQTEYRVFWANCQTAANRTHSKSKQLTDNSH